MFFPVLFFIGIVGAIRWATQPKSTGMTGEMNAGGPVPWNNFRQLEAPAPIDPDGIAPPPPEVIFPQHFATNVSSAEATAIPVTPPPAATPPSPTAPAPQFHDANEPPGMLGPPLIPEEERLFTLLTLWVKDKKFPPGQKRYFTRGLAAETVKLAETLGLIKTANAVASDGPFPLKERLGRRPITVYKAMMFFVKKNKPS
jgi:hypothetical protein